MSYVLGGASAEHERLVRQAPIFNPLTERLFLDAGIGHVFQNEPADDDVEEPGAWDVCDVSLDEAHVV